MPGVNHSMSTASMLSGSMRSVAGQERIRAMSSQRLYASRQSLAQSQRSINRSQQSLNQPSVHGQQSSYGQQQQYGQQPQYGQQRSYHGSTRGSTSAANFWWCHPTLSDITTYLLMSPVTEWCHSIFIWFYYNWDQANCMDSGPSCWLYEAVILMCVCFTQLVSVFTVAGLSVYLYVFMYASKERITRSRIASI